MSDAQKSAQAVALKAEHPDWGYIRIGAEIGWHKDKVRRAIEKAGLNDQLVRSSRAVEAVRESFIEIQPLARMRVPALLKTAKDYAEAIAACWQRSVEAILETGKLLELAKEALEHGEFQKMVEAELPFGPRTASKLMAIGRDERFQNGLTVSHLPPSWGTLYELTRLDDEQFSAKIADGTIRPEMQRQDITSAVKQAKRATRESDLGAKQCALPTQKFGVILADPEWRFEPWSRATGMDRAADNHYPTSVTEVIAARDVPSIAADDCVLFLWIPAPMLPHGLTVMAAWGFDYKSHIIWVKTRDGAGHGLRKLAVGTGYWFRNAHELLLVGTRGSIPAPAMGTQWCSAIDAPIGAHSAKPECFLEMIEEYFPTLPKIELNRRGLARAGWTPWGNEAGEEAA